MHRYIRVTIIHLISLCCVISSSNGFAQSTQGQRKMSLEKLVKQFTPESGRPLTIIVNNLGENGVVCVESSDNTKEVQLQACSINYNDKIKPKIEKMEWLKIEKFKPLLENEVVFSNNTLTVDGHGMSNKRVVVHLSLPILTEFILYVDGKKIGGSFISPNIMVQNHEIVTSPVVGSDNYSFQSAVMQAARLTALQK